MCNVHRPIPILVTKVWRRNLDHVKILQAKYFIGENIPIYSTYTYDINWGALDHASLVPQLMSCVCVHVCLSVCV